MASDWRPIPSNAVQSHPFSRCMNTFWAFTRNRNMQMNSMVTINSFYLAIKIGCKTTLLPTVEYRWENKSKISFHLHVSYEHLKTTLFEAFGVNNSYLKLEMQNGEKMSESVKGLTKLKCVNVFPTKIKNFIKIGLLVGNCVFESNPLLFKCLEPFVFLTSLYCITYENLCILLIWP